MIGCSGKAVFCSFLASFALACVLTALGPALLYADNGTTYLEDINEDGQVTVTDAVELLVKALRNPLDPRLDIDRNGRLNTGDALRLLINLAHGNLTTVDTEDSCLDIWPHPRLLLSGAELEDMRRRMKTGRKEVFSRFEETVRGYPDRDYTSNKNSLRVYIENTSFAYLMTGDTLYFRKARNYLLAGSPYYAELAKTRDTGNWEVVNWRRTIAFAWDWLYNALSEDDRQRIGEYIYTGGVYSGASSSSSPYNGGGYGWFEPLFYPGMALCCDGINEDWAIQWYQRAGRRIREWRDVHMQVASDDGGVYSGMGYASYQYIRAPIFVYESWRSATGEDLLTGLGYLEHFPVWWVYCERPNGELTKIDDLLSVIGEINPWHFRYVANRYRSPLARWLAETREPSPYIRIGDVLWDTADLDFPAAGPDSTWPLGRHFEGIGWVVMRSGWNEDATHAVFKCGNFYYGHQHADENTFVIFKNGSLAIDAGRYEWESDHRESYNARTIAHNTILVYDPNESFGNYVNDGGQVWPRSMPPTYQDLENTEWDTGDITAFETNDRYTYSCGDATNAYSDHKMKLFLRQFIHLQPDAFLIFDRVEAASADYDKYWLLHTIEEPEIEGRVARIDERKGRLLIRSILPEQATMKKVGGPGKEFYVFGRNYPPAESYYNVEEGEEWGSWRIEVCPEQPAEEHLFLHLLLAGDSTLTSIPETFLEKTEEKITVFFTYRELEYIISFNRVGQAGGWITITGNDGSAVLDQPLTETIQPQSGIGR